MRIQPSKGYVFAIDNPVETTTSHGFELRETEGYKPQTATVLASAVEDYSEADVIIYKSYATQEIKIEGKTHILVHEEDVLGKVLNESN